jgi:hypothetical protein
MRLTVIAGREHGVVKGTYAGGPYISLAFGSALAPTEVINVWDDDANTADGILAQWEELPQEIAKAALKAYVGEWIVSQEDPDWYEHYLANAGVRK